MFIFTVSCQITLMISIALFKEKIWKIFLVIRDILLVSLSTVTQI